MTVAGVVRDFVSDTRKVVAFDGAVYLHCANGGSFCALRVCYFWCVPFIWPAVIVIVEPIYCCCSFDSIRGNASLLIGQARGRAAGLEFFLNFV